MTLYQHPQRRGYNERLEIIHQPTDQFLLSSKTYECKVQGPSPLRLALITCQAPACLSNSSNLPFPPLLPSPSGISVTTDLIISLHIFTSFSLSSASPDHSFNPGASWTLPAEVRYARLQKSYGIGWQCSSGFNRFCSTLNAFWDSPGCHQVSSRYDGYLSEGIDGTYCFR